MPQACASGVQVPGPWSWRAASVLPSRGAGQGGAWARFPAASEHGACHLSSSQPHLLLWLSPGHFLPWGCVGLPSTLPLNPELCELRAGVSL